VTDVNRSELSRSLAKAIAYAQCGRQDDAEAWARTLVEQLGCAGILRPDAATYRPWQRT
jgi:hypothetical protein